MGGLADSVVDSIGSSDRDAEKAYRRKGASEKEAKRLVHEDEFFEKVGGSPGTPIRTAGDLDWRNTYP